MDKELINRSIDYILRHFDDSLSVKAVAEHFHFSEFYFSRCFKAATGESVYEFIKRLKLDQSAVDIKLIRDRPITDIGLDYGYSASNYSTAFKKHHSVSPSEFRKSTEVSGMPSPFYPDGLSEFDTFDAYNDKIAIRKLNDSAVIYERVIGNYIDLRDKWQQFLYKYKEYCKKDTLYIERFYDDPTVADPDGCIYDICMTTDDVCTLDNRTIIEGGRYAVYHYEGKIQDIFCSVQGVFSVWLPHSGYIMDKRYGLNIYPQIDTNSDTVCMDLCIPIR